MISSRKEINVALEQLGATYENFDKNSIANTKKVLDAFSANGVALRHFNGTNGYGNDDVGRDTLCKVYAQVFGTEAAIVSPLITTTIALSFLFSIFVSSKSLTFSLIT